MPRHAANGRKNGKRNKTALVCAGGGLTGMVYEAGCLKAIDDFFANFSVLDFDIYVGVSAGAYIASCCANRISPDEMYRDIVERKSRSKTFSRAPIFQLNTSEIVSKIQRVPRLAYETTRTYMRNWRSWTLADFVFSLGELLPSGLMDNTGTGEYLRELFSREDRTDDFRELDKELYVVATNIDTGEATVFGDCCRDTPISLAVQASGALPGIWKPVRIGDTEFVDGGINRTAHMLQAIKHGAGLILCVNPIVPIFNPPERPVLPARNGRPTYLSEKGLPTILDQAFRIVLHSRMKYGLQFYAQSYPDVEIILIEPPRDDLKMFVYNILRYSVRVDIAQHGFATARRIFQRNFDEYATVFAHHGVKLSRELVETEEARMDRGTPLFRNGPMNSLSRSLEKLEMRLRNAS